MAVSISECPYFWKMLRIDVHSSRVWTRVCSVPAWSLGVIIAMEESLSAFLPRVMAPNTMSMEVFDCAFSNVYFFLVT